MNLIKWPSMALMGNRCEGFVERTVEGDVGKWWKFFRSRFMSIGILVTLSLLLCSIVVIENHTEVGMQWGVFNSTKSSNSTYCKIQNHQRSLRGGETLPEGIVEETSDLKLRPLWINPEVKEVRAPVNLLAMAVGINQKENVDQIVKKFPSDNFTVMLFHYDGVANAWNDLAWSRQAIHVAALNQTKWWFAKRFLHPDVVAFYHYIFVWDEDIGVENFHAGRYLAIVEEEGFEISQPALDPQLSEIHHAITVRRKKDRVHRRMFKFRGGGLCLANSTQPPCTGWVEMMVPVFSRAAWRCAWHMIQNDLVHSWGMDMKLGYCAQGDRSMKVGVVNEQYVVHQGIPSLGGHLNKTSETGYYNKSVAHAAAGFERGEVRKRSYVELEIFRQRWIKAVDQDMCWVDPYPDLDSRKGNF